MLCFKIIIVGDTSVGKSCLLLQFTDERFKQTHDATIGIGFGSKEIAVGDQNISLHIWDTAGQESFRSLTRSFYRGYSNITKGKEQLAEYLQSFQGLVHWYEKIQGYACDQIELIIVGNKADLNEQRQVSVNEGMKFATQYKFEYYETSAKTGQQVKHVFEHLAQKIHSKVISGLIDLSKENYGITIGDKVSKNYFNKQATQKTTEKESVKNSCC